MHVQFGRVNVPTSTGHQISWLLISTWVKISWNL